MKNISETSLTQKRPCFFKKDKECEKKVCYEGKSLNFIGEK